MVQALLYGSASPTLSTWQILIWITLEWRNNSSDIQLYIVDMSHNMSHISGPLRVPKAEAEIKVTYVGRAMPGRITSTWR